MRKNYKWLILVLILVLLLPACKKKEEEVEEVLEVIVEETPEPIEEEAEVVEEEVEEKPGSLLSGVEVGEDERELPIVGIMLDNHPNARWQAGLREAEVVYEIRVEGNFTRYLAMYQVGDPKVIGPIRSARTPFVNRILEYGAIYVHYGGSPAGLQDVADFKVSSIDGMAVGEPVYYRNHSVGKEAPHNAYSSMEEIRAYGERRGFPEKTEFEGYNFYSEKTLPGEKEALSFTINIMSGNTTAYVYQEEEGFYHRYKDGELHIDENDKEPLEVTNVIIQYADGILVDDRGRVNLDDVGQGEGLIFSQGHYADISWEKKDRSSPTLFYDDEGEPLKLNVGQTFIQVVDRDVLVNLD